MSLSYAVIGASGRIGPPTGGRDARRRKQKRPGEAPAFVRICRAG
ncbi:hypothetical protein DESPIG_01868 [Desulfovibrio piger ATCC 29098]|uniref:Uncharacterized protein n=1 Tax=Desulfovibrio piger ATCC 29098 TaxID=411464 RepID=B6WUV7_9BACT|nr:hypothetical protein DESPIG_01868 [Desulfovibrio piger ATCC 29098]